MVSLIPIEFGLYLKKNTDDSILLKSFSHYLFNNIDTADFKYLLAPGMSYKDTSALGYISTWDKDYESSFVSSTKWLIGRQILPSDALMKDNIALLGLVVGINSLKDEELATDFRNWFNALIEGNYLKQIINKDFLKSLLFDHQPINASNALDADLYIFRNILTDQEKIDTSVLSKYFQGFSGRIFPFYPDDFFRTVINAYNLIHIQSKYINTFSDFENALNSAKNMEKEKLEIQIKRILDRQADSFAGTVILLFLLVLIVLFSVQATLINKNNWDVLEPITFVAVGTSLLVYIIHLAYLWAYSKELSFNPGAIKRTLYEYKRKKLYKRFGFDE